MSHARAVLCSSFMYRMLLMRWVCVTDEQSATLAAYDLCRCDVCGAVTLMSLYNEAPLQTDISSGVWVAMTEVAAAISEEVRLHLLSLLVAMLIAVVYDRRHIPLRLPVRPYGHLCLPTLGRSLHLCSPPYCISMFDPVVADVALFGIR